MIIRRALEPQWVSALYKLSHGAFYMLNVLWYDDFEVSDKSLMARTGVGMSSHRKHKKELADNGYLTKSQVGKGRYRYNVGENVNG